MSPKLLRKLTNWPFHFEIWRGPTKSFGDEPKAIYYVENHNAQCGYAEVALDFSIAANSLLEKYERESLGNWMGPTAHLIRQTLELKLKALLQAVIALDSSVNSKPLATHRLLDIWDPSYAWIASNSLPIEQDLRLPQTLHLLQCYDSIDPTGDLFRFGQSRQSWFGRPKSYDRVGIEIDVMKDDFAAAEGLLDHWESVASRSAMSQEMGWEKDPYFNPNDFPK